MKANRLSVSQRQAVQKAAEREVKDLIAEAGVMSQKRMYLRVLHCLRFDFHFKKRLMDFLDLFANYNEKTQELNSDCVLATVMVSDLEKSGICLDGFFDDLIEFEEKQYQREKAKEQGIRNAKGLSLQQMNELEKEKRRLEK